MKVVHLGDSDAGGGAAHAMLGLHDALRRGGTDSHLLLHRAVGERPDRHTIATRGDADRLLSEQYDALRRHYVERNRSARSNTHFSLYVDGIDASQHPAVRESALVHLHWTASFQTPADVGALLDAKPLAWTLHDLGPLTGGCHFPAGCTNYGTSCAGCPQLVRDPFEVTATTLRDKSAQWHGRPITFIAPSRHMASLARSSALVRRLDATIAHVPLGVDTDAFRPASKAAARRALGIPVDGRYVVCGSHHNAEHRKNLSVVHRIVSAACSQQPPGGPDVTLVTIGEPKLDVPEHRPYRTLQLGLVPLAAMPAIYAAADVFLHPSVEDNLPCMLLEASSCGTPSVAFDVGGVAEIVLDGISGHVVAAPDETAMAAALSALLRDPERCERMGRDARARAVHEFGDMTSARRHLALYDEMLALPRIAPHPRPATTALEAIVPQWSAACLLADVRDARASEADAAARAAHSVAIDAQLREKDAEITAVHRVAEERATLAGELHAAAERMRVIADDLQRDLRDRDAALRRMDRQLDEKEALIVDLHRSATERLEIIEALERAIGERDVALARLTATIDEQRSEIELAHRVASERGRLIDDLHHIAQQRAARIAGLERPSLLRRLAVKFRHR